jgi:hypothetical protein
VPQQDCSLFRAERDLRRQPGPEQHRHGDQSTTACDRIDKSRPEARKEKCRVNPRIEVHGIEKLESGKRMTRSVLQSAVPCASVILRGCKGRRSANFAERIELSHSKLNMDEPQPCEPGYRNSEYG